MTTIKEVARRAGVSVPTAYKVFGATYYTSPEIQQRVFDAAKDLGYTHKPAQKALAQHKTIGVVLDDVANPFYGFMLREIARELRFHEYEVMTLYHGGSAVQEQRILENLHSYKVDGIVFLPSPMSDDGFIAQLVSLRYPMVQLFRPVYDAVDTVLIDDELGTMEAVQHLLERGHRRIMLISPTNPILIKRENGYKRAFETAGISCDPDYIYLMNLGNAKEMIKDKISAMQPTAILTVGEPTSIDVLQALTESGKRVPDDISMIIYDDLPWTGAFSYTAVGHSFTDIGRSICKLLLGRIEEKRAATSPGQPAKLMLNPRLISRNSVKSLA